MLFQQKRLFSATTSLVYLDDAASDVDVAVSDVVVVDDVVVVGSDAVVVVDDVVVVGLDAGVVAASNIDIIVVVVSVQRWCCVRCYH